MKRLIADANKVKEANGEMADLSIDSFADVAEAIHIIQSEMGITGTTAREAATTIEGSLSMMKGAWQNLVVGMADENANMEVLMNNFVESTVTVAGNIMPRIEQALKGVGQLIEGLAPVIADALPGLVSSVLPSLLNAAVGLVGSLASALPSLVEMLVNDLLPQLLLGVVTITTSLVSALPQLIETIASALPSLIHLLINDGLVPLVLAICANLPLILAPIIAELPNILLSVSDALLQNLDVLIQGLVDLCLAIIPMIPQIILSLLDAAPKIISMVTDALIKSAPILGKGLMQICKSMATEMLNYWKQFPEKLLEIGRSVINLFSELFSPVAEWFNTNVIQPVAQFFADLWQGVCDGVSAAWSWISGICSTVGTWIYNNVIAPVAKFFTDLWNGIVNAWHTVIDPWVEIVKRLATMFYDSVIKPVADFFADLWRKITKGAREAWNGVVSVYSVVSGWFNEKIIQPVSNFFTKMWSGLKSGASSAWSGITSVFSNVTSWFRDKFTQAWTAVKNVFSTGGKVFDGIKDGIVSVFKTVVNAIIGGINKVIKVPFDAINSALKKIRNVEIVGVKPFDWITTFNVPQIPKLSTGLNFVPYDEYPAFLHRGEAVLTASQAQAWRNGGTVGNGQIVSVLVSILDAITGGNKELLEAILSGHVIALNEREVGRVVKTYA